MGGQWEQWEGRGDGLGDACGLCLKRETIAKYGNFACIVYEILHMNVHCLYDLYVCLHTLNNILGCPTLYSTPPLITFTVPKSFHEASYTP